MTDHKPLLAVRSVYHAPLKKARHPRNFDDETAVFGDEICDFGSHFGGFASPFARFDHDFLVSAEIKTTRLMKV